MTRRSGPEPGQAEIRWFGVVLLVGHLALLTIGAVSLWRISGAAWWLGALAAVGFTLVYAALWRFLLAPGSRQRLRFKDRLATTLVTGIAVLIVASLGSLWLPALVAISVVLLGDTLDERSALD